MKTYRKLILFLVSLIFISSYVQASDSKKSMMSDFEKGFKELDQKLIEELYINDAIIISKGIKTEGNIAIARQFREKGMEKVDVKFTTTEIIQGNNLIYEKGIFQDYDKKSGHEVGKGDYFIVWEKDKDRYKIKLHTWTEELKTNQNSSSIKADSKSQHSSQMVIKGNFSNPESVLHDEVRDVYLVSNMNGNKHSVKDNKGFISVVSPDGKILDAHWIAGGKNDVTLNKPTGMALVGRILWVADHNTVRSFDAYTGKAIAKVDFPNAACLNDLIANSKGEIYVSDCGLNDDFAPSNTSAIWKIDLNGKVEKIEGLSASSHPNGLSIDQQDRIYFVNLSSPGAINVVENNQVKIAQNLPKGMLDGLAFDDAGRAFVSSWAGKVVYVIQDKKITELPKSDGVADLALDRKRQKILMPILYKNGNPPIFNRSFQ